MENLIKMDDLGGYPTIFGNIHISKNHPLCYPKYLSMCWTVARKDCPEPSPHETAGLYLCLCPYHHHPTHGLHGHRCKNCHEGTTLAVHGTCTWPQLSKGWFKPREPLAQAQMHSISPSCCLVVLHIRAGTFSKTSKSVHHHTHEVHHAWPELRVIHLQIASKNWSLMGSFQNHLINAQSGATCMFSPLIYRNCPKFYCKKKRQWVECSCWSMPSDPFLWERLLNTSSRSWKMHGVSSSWPMPMWLHCNTGWILLHLWHTRINPNTFLQWVKQDVLL